MLRDTGLVFVYQTRRLLRAPVVIVVGIMQPLLWLLLFGPLLDSLTGPGLGSSDAFDLFAPGLLVMLALYGSLYTGFELISELRAGVVERMVVTPMRPTALILGKALRDVLALGVQAGILLLIAFAMGLDADFGGLLLALGLFVIVVVMTASFSYAVALTLRDENMMSQSMGFLSLPLLLLSGVVLPLGLAPGWLRDIAQANPFYHVVEASRAAMSGDFSDSSIVVALGFSVGLTLLVMRWAVGSLRRG
ncbi:ABC transporter permease [Streptomyces albicerus]|uniref:ABC transporter permease n=1 Tax=Streptomyces albicerus TaxID=2569859 RepID=UPI00124BB611|nr:ABC transporter permease [Streptomyces albicerus]